MPNQQAANDSRHLLHDGRGCAPPPRSQAQNPGGTTCSFGPSTSATFEVECHAALLGGAFGALGRCRGGGILLVDMITEAENS